MGRTLLSGICLLVTSMITVSQADEAEDYQQIRDLLRKDQFNEDTFTEAEEVYDAAIKQYPDSSRIRKLRSRMLYWSNAFKKYESAIRHLDSYIDENLLPSEQSPQGDYRSLPFYANLLVTSYEKAGRLKDAGARLDQLLTHLESVIQHDQENVYAQLAFRNLHNLKLVFLTHLGQRDQAQSILALRLSATENLVKDQPESKLALLDLLYLLKGEFQLADEANSDDAEQKQQQFLDKIMTAAVEHPENAPLVVAAIDEYAAYITRDGRWEPDRAEARLQKLRRLTGSLESDIPLISERISYVTRAADSLQSFIDSGKVHANLIGKDACPLNAVAWANGTPLTDSDLKGKVVLLHFWTADDWPCIVTFPLLREWQKKYGDKGLVIIGVTRYSKLGWNEELNEAEFRDEISEEEERSAMAKLAKHHGLKHRILITSPEEPMQKSYAVTELPQLVLIDREGKIRLIRVNGAVADDARRVEKRIARLIGKGQ